MKKKRLIFPEKLKQWIDARTQYKLTHAHIEMARELGMDPKKFEGIVKHIREHASQELAEFIEVSYKERFGKAEPDDHRSIEQKIKAEAAEKEQKRMRKAEGKARAKWDAFPETEKTAILSNVWCSHCMSTTTISEIECQLINDGLLLNGKCSVCGNVVGRYIEGE
jgi:hypothetical protein